MHTLALTAISTEELVGVAWSVRIFAFLGAWHPDAVALLESEAGDALAHLTTAVKETNQELFAALRVGIEETSR